MLFNEKTSHHTLICICQFHKSRNVTFFWNCYLAVCCRKSQRRTTSSQPTVPAPPAPSEWILWTPFFQTRYREVGTSSHTRWTYDCIQNLSPVFSLVGQQTVLGIRIQIRIRKDPSVLKDPNPIKPSGFGSEGKFYLVKHIIKGKIHLWDNKHLPKKLLKTVLQFNKMHLKKKLKIIVPILNTENFFL